MTLASTQIAAQECANCNVRQAGTKIPMPVSLLKFPPLTPKIVSCIVFLIMAARVGYFHFSPDEKLITIIPDDAFYYFQIAKHRAVDGAWTFDGTNPATGFHFLYANLLVGIYRLSPGIDWRVLYLLISTLAAISISLSAFIISYVVEKKYKKWPLYLTIIPFVSVVAVQQSTSMMESWLVILCSSLTVFMVASSKPPRPADLFACLVVGFVGSLARSDYGLFPGCLFLANLLTSRTQGFSGIGRSAILLVGAALGVCFLIAHNYSISGEFTQSSAQVKLFWSSLNGHSIRPIIHLITITATSINKIVAYIFLVLIIFFMVILRKEIIRDWTKICFLNLGSLLTLLGYLFFYRCNSEALAPWYCANLVVPISILFSYFCYLFMKTWTFSKPLMVMLFLYSVLSGIWNFNHIVWPAQRGMMYAGLNVAQQRLSGKIGAWNAGILSYFSGLKVVNIDGLVNDTAVTFIKSHNLSAYIANEGISYIADYGIMLKFGARGGYGDDFLSCLRYVSAIDGDRPKFFDTNLSLYSVKQDCLRRHTLEH